MKNRKKRSLRLLLIFIFGPDKDAIFYSYKLYSIRHWSLLLNMIPKIMSEAKKRKAKQQKNVFLSQRATLFLWFYLMYIFIALGVRLFFFFFAVLGQWWTRRFRLVLCFFFHLGFFFFSFIIFCTFLLVSFLRLFCMR